MSHRIIFAPSLLLLLTHLALAQKQVSLPTQDGGLVYADIYGDGERGVVLAHGGRFDKESWKPQAEALAHAGFRVLAIDFRGHGQSHGGKPLASGDDGYRFDVLAGVDYLRKNGAKTVSAVGGSFGGSAAAEASEAEPGAIGRIVLLGASADNPEKLQGRKLFIVARDDANSEGLRLPKIRASYDRTSEPKQLIVLDGSAHAQFLFQTDQGERVMREILRFLSAP